LPKIKQNKYKLPTPNPDLACIFFAKIKQNKYKPPTPNPQPPKLPSQKEKRTKKEKTMQTRF